MTAETAARADLPPRPELSICVVNWNAGDVLRDCLQAIYEDERSASWELFVVDNASTDSSPDMVRNEFPQVELLEPGENLGFSRANNLALGQATGDLLLLLNPDTRPGPGALGELVDFMRARPAIGIAGPRLVRPDGRLELSCGRIPTPLGEIGRKLLLHRVFPFFRFVGWDHRTTRSVGWVTGACLMIRRETAEQTGYLDPQIFMCLEDVDWCMRAHQSGWEVAFFPGSEVVHIGGHSIRANFTEMLVVSQQSQLYLFHKHFGSFHLHVLRLFTVVEMLLRSVLWSFMGAWPGRRREGKQRLRAYFRILQKTLLQRSYYRPSESDTPSGKRND